MAEKNLHHSGHMPVDNGYGTKRIELMAQNNPQHNGHMSVDNGYGTKRTETDG